MLIIPAIDLKNGQCVRLRRGVMDDATVYSDDPVDMARKWVKQGARRLHIVDLDGAISGYPVNSGAIKSILSEIAGEVPVQLGGGLRDLNAIEEYISDGVSYVILGTAAVKNPDFVKNACQAFRGQVIVGVDANNGEVAVEGWSELTSKTVSGLAKGLQGVGVESIIYTDINRDGMGSGINIEATKNLAESINIPVIASGGLTSLEDVRKLSNCEGTGIFGVIAGRALYDNAINLSEAQAISDKLSEKI